MKKNMIYLVVLGAASLLVMAGVLAGCAGSTNGNSTTPPPTQSVSIVAVRSAVLGENGTKAISFASNFTVTNPNGSDTAISCASSDANKATIVDPVACTITPSPTNSGNVTITATAHADSTKTASFTMHVGNYVLVNSSTYGLQVVNAGVSGSVVTLMANNQPCIQESWSPDYQGILCVDFMSQGPSKVGVYKTDGTAAGTTLVGNEIDFSSIGTPNHVTVTYLSYSPDGKTILFTAVADGVQGVWTASASGSNPVKLFTEPTSGVAVGRARFTPDGKQILFEELSTLAVWAMNADGSNPHQLVFAPSAWAMYSPDMTTLYYANYAGGVWYTYVKNVATGVITKTLTGYDILAVSPNGASILLTDGTSIFVADASGANLSSSPIATGGWGAW